MPAKDLTEYLEKAGAYRGNYQYEYIDASGATRVHESRGSEKNKEAAKSALIGMDKRLDVERKKLKEAATSGNSEQAIIVARAAHTLAADARAKASAHGFPSEKYTKEMKLMTASIDASKRIQQSRVADARRGASERRKTKAGKPLTGADKLKAPGLDAMTVERVLGRMSPKLLEENLRAGDFTKPQLQKIRAVAEAAGLTPVATAARNIAKWMEGGGKGKSTKRDVGGRESLDFTQTEANAKNMTNSELEGALSDILSTLPSADDLDRASGSDRGGNFYRRVPHESGKGHRYYYTAEKYQARKDAHVSGEDLQKQAMGKGLTKMLDKAGEHGCAVKDLKDMVKKYGSKAVSGHFQKDCGEGGGSMFANGRFYRRRGSK